MGCCWQALSTALALRHPTHVALAPSLLLPAASDRDDCVEFLYYITPAYFLVGRCRGTFLRDAPKSNSSWRFILTLMGGLGSRETTTARFESLSYPQRALLQMSVSGLGYCHADICLLVLNFQPLPNTRSPKKSHSASLAQQKLKSNKPLNSQNSPSERSYPV